MIGGESTADLPSEPGPVDPGAEAVEPPFVHLSVVHREMESAEAGVGKHRDRTRHERDEVDGVASGSGNMSTTTVSPAMHRPNVAPPTTLPTTYHRAMARKRWSPPPRRAA